MSVAAPVGDMPQHRVGGDEEVAGPDGELPPGPAGLREAGADVQTGRARMLCASAKVEAEMLELDSEGTIDRVGAVAPDVDVHLSRSVLKNASDGGRESRFVRPT